MTTFNVDNEAGLQALETHLSTNAYLSGSNLPNQEDSRVLGLLKDAPNRSTYPNLFSWWWNLVPFQEEARALWGQTKAKKGGKKKQTKQEDDDDFDPFAEGGDDEADQEELEKQKILAAKQKRMKEKMKNQKSQITINIKGFEVGQDFKDLARRIKEEFTWEGLTW